jgi:general secretion pathway protein J
MSRSAGRARATLPLKGREASRGARSARLHMVGFTLLEVLVAISIFAVLSALAYGGLTQMLEGRDRIEAQRALWRNLALAMAQLEDDLAQARPRGVRDVSGASLPPFQIEPVDPRPLAPPILEFTRGGSYLTAESTGPDLQRVGYKVSEGKLIRIVWPVLDRPPVVEPVASTLLTNIDNLTLRPYGPNAAGAQSWPGTNQGMPDAVELAFDVAGIGRIRRVLLVGK